MRSGTNTLQMQGGKKSPSQIAEEKYNLAYRNPDYQKPSVGTAALTYIVAKLKFSSVLDVGCGMGFQLLGFLKSGKDVRGIEVCDYLLDNFLKVFVQTDLVRKARIQQIPFNAETFDLVYCTDVLEHLVEGDVDVAIEELVRVSRKYIFVTVACGPTILCQELKLHETIKPISWWDNKWKKYRLKRVATDLIRSSGEGEVYLWRKY